MYSDGDDPRGPGCPIRRSPDQHSLTIPRSFSQPATSFFASRCQGIHQMPFLALDRMTNPATARKLTPQQPDRTGQHSRAQAPQGPGPARCFDSRSSHRSTHPARRRRPTRQAPWASPLHHVKDPEDRCQITDIARHRPLDKVTNQCHKPMPQTNRTNQARKPSPQTNRTRPPRLAGPWPARLRRGSLRSLRQRRLVELNGIEPMTSCLQSRRSPN